MELTFQSEGDTREELERKADKALERSNKKTSSN